LLLLFQIGTPPPSPPLFFFASVECGGAIQIQILQPNLEGGIVVQFLFVEFF
jgi:hypothetical protein